MLESIIQHKGRPGRAPIDYTRVDRGTREQLPRYLETLIKSLALARRPEGLVIEVGTNDGAFLTRLFEHGFTHRLGIEPSEALAGHAKRRGTRLRMST